MCGWTPISAPTSSPALAISRRIERQAQPDDRRTGLAVVTLEIDPARSSSVNPPATFSRLPAVDVSAKLAHPTGLPDCICGDG